MKYLKFIFLNIVLVVFLLMSCTNDNSVEAQINQTEDSQSIITVLNHLNNQLDSNGNIDKTENPTGNIVFDFCFDFVYPVTLSYNNSNNATVAVADLNGLRDIILASTDSLYISGISFPFDAEIFDNTKNSIVIETINGELEFTELLFNCDFDNTVVCPEIYDPVCTEVTEPNGTVFTITYPNECYAIQDGFTETDFIDDCIIDVYFGLGLDCFSINFPVDIITEDSEIITINSDQEFYNAIYDVYVYDFIYPFTLTVNEDNTADTVTINTEADFEIILENCYISFPCSEVYDPVCVELIDVNGNSSIFTYYNECYALLDGFTFDDFVECDDDFIPGDQCEESFITFIFSGCQGWQVIVDGLEFLGYIFNSDNTLLIFDSNGIVAVGNWAISTDEISGAPIMTLSTNSDSFTEVWFFVNCDGNEYFEVITSGGEVLEIEAACD